MIMNPGVRKLTLTAHLVVSIGWLGAVISFLALAIVGLISQDDQTARACYLAMELIALLAILPLCLAALLTGIIASLGTKWGLFRHYWVLVKLALTLFSTLVLLVHLQPIRYMAEMARQTALTGPGLQQLKIQLVIDAGAALLVLIVATVLSVYKPQGMTAYGWRKQYEQSSRLPIADEGI
jgi:hypothetical protein